MYKISVIIPVEPEGSASLCINSLRKIKWNRKEFEILLCYGRNPARQRNKAAQKARGDILFFLDSDSMTDEYLFEKNIKCYQENDNVACCGGPSLLPNDASFIQKLLDSVLSSYFGTAMSACRYSSKGEKRKATEAELILCNLSIRRNIFEANGGFDERLFPNEENEFLQRLKKKGYFLIYEPEAKVFRYPEKNLFRFLKHIFNYGRGRSEQFFIKSHLTFIFHLIPFLFFCYIVILFFNINFYLILPLLVYLVLNLFFSYKKAKIKKNYIYLLFLPPLFFLLHLSYGIGIFCGIFSSIFKIKRAPFFSDANVRIIKSFDEE